MKRLFHYTTVSRLQKIMQDKAIKPTAIYIDKGEKAAVWFSFRQDWEPTASPARVDASTGRRRTLTFNEIAEVEPPAPIEITPSAAPLTWRAWRKSSGVKPKTARELEIAALRMDSDVADWRISFDPVTVASGAWLVIELFVEGQWQDIDLVLRAADELKPA